MKRERRLLGGLDPVMLLAIGLLAGLSAANLIALGDASRARHQLEAVGLGLVLMAACQRSRRPSLGVISIAAYLAGVLLLLAVSRHGHSAYGAQRWLALGPVALQPSELAKLGLLLALSQVLGQSSVSGRRRFLAALGLGAAPIALTIHQPDLSTAGLLAVVLLSALLLARVELRFLAALGGAAVVLAAVAVPLAHRVLRPYQLARLHAFVGGSHDPQGAGWQAIQSHVAVAAGGLFGISRQPLHLLWAQYLPARQTDLAFDSLVEQWGLVAGSLAIVAVLLLLWRLVRLARVARNTTTGIMAGAMAMLIGVEVAVNLAGNLGALPLAGVPFPILSYGGTAAAAHLAALGMVLSARREAERRRLWHLPAGLLKRPRLMRLGAVCLTGAMISMAGLAWRIQVHGAGLVAYGQSEMTRCFRLPAARGSITDRHGVPLATNVPADRVFVVPALVLRSGAELGRIARLTGRPGPVLVARLRQAAGALDLEIGEVSAAAGAALRTARLRGVDVVPADQRHYPYGAALGPVLGYTGIADLVQMRADRSLPLGAVVGKAGLEAAYDGRLRGQDGQDCLYVDPQGVPVAPASVRPPVAGQDLITSLDLGMQLAADARVQKALAGSTSDQVAAVVMDPRNGEVLAMASRPAYDDNLFTGHVDMTAIAAAGRGPGHPFLEHVTQTASPPGSNFKLVVGAADGIYGAIPVHEVIPTGYTFRFGTATFTNWQALPPQDLIQAIAWSNDVYFYKLALALGADRIVKVAHALGVGRPTGIDLPGESAGYLGSPQTVGAIGAHWWPGSTVILGIGQGYIMTTPLQDARWTAAVATGALVTPRLGLAVSGSGPRAAPLALPHPGPQALPFAGAQGPVRAGMRLSVTTGTSNLLAGIPIDAGGKTGTAEDPSTVSGREDGWYTCAAPMSAPRVVMTMEARGSGEGYFVAEPAVADMLRYFTAHQAQVEAPLPSPGP
ncbi:MAG: FtsW/RodA/SpoVE family cell cycle protein [Candidatus Dormibacteraceae bacterium]